MSANPPSAAEKGKGKEEEPKHLDTKRTDNPTTPPRVSFGLELEFLVAELRTGDEDPDKDLAHLLPPVYPVDETAGEIRKLLAQNEIPVINNSNWGALEGPDASDYEEKHTQGFPTTGWQVGHDHSLAEQADTGYEFGNIELRAPASFAMTQTFDMIHLVVHLITSNFRVRVNKTTGFHVHVGNGFDRISARASRNFGALLWAAEPLLSTLHPPERSSTIHAKSVRRYNTTHLALGGTTEQLRYRFANQYNTYLRAQQRSIGRDRKLGEPAEERLVATFFPNSTYWDGDQVNWEVDGYEPFKRPSRGQTQTLPPDEERMANPFRRTIKRGPPEIPSRPLAQNASGPYHELRAHGEALPGDAGNGDMSLRSASSIMHQRPELFVGSRHTRRDPAERVALHTKRGKAQLSSRPPPFPKNPERKRRNSNTWKSSRDVGKRLDEYDQDELLYSTSTNQGTWPAVREVLSCDIGAHQVGNAFYKSARGVNWNWLAYTMLHKPVVLPVSELKPEGQELRMLQDQYEGDQSMDIARTTVESREGQGTLDSAWIVTWCKICCGLLEYSRDADPAEFMRVLALCSRASEEPGPKAYDVVDLLYDIGLYAEARHCERRLERQEEAWFDTMLLSRYRRNWNSEISSSGLPSLNGNFGVASPGGLSTGVTSPGPVVLRVTNPDPPSPGVASLEDASSGGISYGSSDVPAAQSGKTDSVLDPSELSDSGEDPGVATFGAVSSGGLTYGNSDVPAAQSGTIGSALDSSDPGEDSDETAVLLKMAKPVADRFD